MIGIDIVDLNDPLFRKRTKRSLDLISNPKDQTIDHPQLFWLFWSAKEAVFKTKREIRSFAPKDIPISLIIEDSKIKFDSEGIKGVIQVDENYILSVAGNENGDLEHLVVNENCDDWSDTVRKKIKSHFFKKGISADVSRCEKGLPILNDRLPISITHHGKYAAFAYPKTVLMSNS